MSDVGVFPMKGPIVSTKVDMTQTAAKIPASPLSGRRFMLIQNTGSEIVFLGPSTVDSTNGYDLAAGDVVPLELDASLDIYGVCASGKTSTIKVLEIAG
jgi:hypothetical protein